MSVPKISTPFQFDFESFGLEEINDGRKPYVFDPLAVEFSYTRTEQEYADPEEYSEYLRNPSSEDRYLQGWKVAGSKSKSSKRPPSGLGPKILGSEVGDDRVDCSAHPQLLALMLNVQETVFGMKTSKEDTFISRDIWNFCEVTSTTCVTSRESFDHARRVNDFSNLGYVDTIPLRIILDVSKSDRSHSSTSVGKCAMLASRVTTPNSQLRLAWSLASYLQDSYLNTADMPDPKYLERIMGGCGCRPNFDSADNLFLYVKAFRNGSYDRVYGSAVNELRMCLGQYDLGTPFCPTLCFRLRDKQEYLHGTYAEKVFVPKKGLLEPLSDVLPPPLYEACGVTNAIQGTEQRLLRARLLTGRRDAEVMYRQKARLDRTLFGDFPVPYTEILERREKSDARKKFGGALQGNSAFQNLLARRATSKDVHALLKDYFHCVGSGVMHFSSRDAEWLFHGGRSEFHSIMDISRVEDMFLTSEISSESDFKVSGIPLMPIMGGKHHTISTVKRLGLYEINDDMLEWANRKIAQLEQIRGMGKEPIPHGLVLPIYFRDREWVNDDTLLIQKCLDDVRSLPSGATSVILVSKDRRLANQMSRTCNITVLRIDPDEVIATHIKSSYSSLTELTVHDLMPSLRLEGTRVRVTPTHVYIDTGSMASAAVHYVAADEVQYESRKLHKVDYVATNPCHGVGRNFTRRVWKPVHNVFMKYEMHTAPSSSYTLRANRTLSETYSTAGIPAVLTPRCLNPGTRSVLW